MAAVLQLPNPRPASGSDAIVAARATAFHSQILSSALTSSQIAEEFGLAGRQVVDLANSGHLSWVHHDDYGRVYPSWQFSGFGVLDGTAGIIAAFPGVPMGLAHWMGLPSSALDGTTPRTALAAGRVADVLAAIGSAPSSARR